MTKQEIASTSGDASAKPQAGPGLVPPPVSEANGKRFGEWALHHVDQGNKDLWMVRFERKQPSFCFARVVIELNWVGPDTMFGVLVLPHGLKMAEGVRIGLDDGSWGQKLPFATYGPAGGIVKLDIKQEALERVRQSSKLLIRTRPAAGKRMLVFSVPLDGFCAASDALKTLNGQTLS